ncbi:DUF1877 family protein [Arthrobacter sp. 18067]|uniref:DUF1877 family protein n=1 Tax=Arthrobacter sp. 18067 TaxID=2681413 RepID=UPI001357FC55|nr:DUF1877 family protein [Arthrobacter sp. 18067]
MGIRYYAYAFDGDVTDLVLADPRRFLSSDPLADAWGLESAGGVTIAAFEQSVPECDMLYLDKAWRFLQVCTGPLTPGAEARPAFRMFEGQVTMHHDGWEPWLRVLTPVDVAVVSQDLDRISDADMRLCLGHMPYTDQQSDFRYTSQYLQRARSFAANLRAAGRGMVYLIG